MEKLSPEHPTLSALITAFDKLDVRLQMSTMRVQWEGGLPPFSAAIRDVEAAGPGAWIRDAFRHIDLDGLNKTKEFLKSVETSLNSPQSSPLNYPCLSAWSIPATKNGMGKYVLRFQELVQPYIVMGLSGTTTPGGNCSDVHIDFTGLSVYVTSIGGPKLVFIFPPTKKNLDIYRNFHYLQHPIMLFSFLSRMEGWRFVILHPGRGIRLPPGTIHAVISVRWSTSYGPVVAEYRALEEAATTMQRELGVLMERKSDRNEEIRESARELKNTLINNHRLWLRLAKRLGGDQKTGDRGEAFIFE